MYSIVVTRDVGEAYQAETEASGDETEALVNRSESRPRRSHEKARQRRVHKNIIFLWARVYEMIH
jgi:hypothetical protein